MFCVRCGREGETINGLCMDCFLNGRMLISTPHHVDLERCTSCEEFNLGGRWVSTGIEEAVEEAAIGSLTVISEGKAVEVGARVREMDPRNYEVELDVDVDIDGHVETVHDTTTVRLKNTVCHRCSRQLGNYYESILQLRSGEKELARPFLEDLLELVTSKVETASRSNRQLFISKVEEMHGGLDFYLSSISLGKSLAKELVAEFGAELKESSTLVGKKDDGSDMYRVTYLVRMPPYQAGDVVIWNDDPHQIASVGKNGGKLLNLRDFRIQSVRPADMRGLKVVQKKDDFRDAVVVNTSESEAQVMHPVNYRTLELRLPPGYVPGETVKVAEIEDELFIIPDASSN